MNNIKFLYTINFFLCVHQKKKEIYKNATKKAYNYINKSLSFSQQAIEIINILHKTLKNFSYKLCLNSNNSYT